MFEVDVFKHPRFCDEFSQVVNSRFPLTETLCRSLFSMEEVFETIQMSSLILTMVIKLLVIFFISLTSM